MSIFKQQSFKERQADAAAAKRAMLERARSVASDDALAERRAEREKIVEARNVRAAEREAARIAREAEEAAAAERAAEAARLAAIEEEKLAAAIKAEEEERHAALLIQQKADRDARYAARKAAKKDRRKG